MQQEKKNQVQAKINLIKNRLETLKSTKIQNETQLRLLSERIDNKNSEIKEQTKKNEKLNAEKCKIRATITLLGGNFDHYMGRIQSLKLKIKEIERNISQTSAEVSDMEHSHRVKTNSVQYWSLNTLKRRLAILKNNLEEPKIDLNILEEKKNNTDSEIRANKSKLIQIEQESQSTMAHLRIAEGELNSYRLQQQNLNSSIKEIERDLTSNGNSLQNEQADLNKILLELENLRINGEGNLKRCIGRKTF